MKNRKKWKYMMKKKKPLPKLLSFQFITKDTKGKQSFR